MPKYRVSFNGWYIIEADSIDEAVETSMDDFDVEYAEYENTDAEIVEV